MSRVMVTLVCSTCHRGTWYEWRSDVDGPVHKCRNCGEPMVERERCAVVKVGKMPVTEREARRRSAAALTRGTRP